MVEIENKTGMRVIVGFSMGENYYKNSKLFPFENMLARKVSRDFLPVGKEFIHVLARYSSGFSNELACNLFWQKIILRKQEYYQQEREKEKESGYYLSMLEREEEKFTHNKELLLNEQKFSALFVPPVNVSRRRRNFISKTVLPDCNDYVFENLVDFNYAFIFDLKAMKLNIYMENFPIKEKLKDNFGSMNYVCSFSPNSLAFANGAAGNFNFLEFVKRNHEQEVILKNHPCNKDTTKNRKKRKRFY